LPSPSLQAQLPDTPASAPTQYWLEQSLSQPHAWPTCAEPLPVQPPVERVLAVQTPLRQLPVQQSRSELHDVPRPALGLSGVQLLQSVEMSQPVGHVTSPHWFAGGLPDDELQAVANAATAARHRRRFIETSPVEKAAATYSKATREVKAELA